MQASNVNQPGRSDDPVWQFLVEYPLSEFLPDHDKGGEPMAGLLSQTGREWDIPFEYLENIDMTLTGFAKGAQERFNQACVELPGRIRVFCQKNLIYDAHSAKTSRLYNAEKVTEHTQIVQLSGTKMNGGWGYFIIERSGGDADSSERTYLLVDLYLYKERS